MNSDFDQDFDRVVQLADNPDTEYEMIEAALRTLKRYRMPEQQQQARDLELNIRTQRRNNFEKLLEEVRDLITEGQIQTRNAFDEYAIKLTQRARPNAVREDIEALRTEWNHKGQVDTVRQKVYFWIDKFQDAIAGGMNPHRAGEEYLEKAEEVLNHAKAQIRDSSQVDELFADVSEVMRAVDKRPLHTLATQQEYQEILTSLRRKKEMSAQSDGRGKHFRRDEEDVYDANGILVGRKSLDQAIEDYAEMAREYARQKANQYEQDAQRHLDRERPYSAEKSINDIYTLYLLPEESRQHAKAFYDLHIEPVLKRINHARDRLRAVLGTRDIEIALDYYHEALDKDTGWPSFRTMAESDQGDIGIEVYDDFSVARDYLLKGIESEIESRLAFLSSEEPIWLPVMLSEADFAHLEHYLNFENNALKNAYMVKLAQLKTAYQMQLEQGNQGRALYEPVMELVEAGQYEDAHRRLSLYGDMLDKFPEIFPEESQLWKTVVLFHDGLAIFQDLELRLTAGITAKPAIAVQLADVNALIERSEDAQRTIILQDVSVQDWEDRLRALRDLRELLEGEVLYEQRKFSEAIRVWGGVSQYVPTFAEHAQQRIRDADDRMKTDRELLQANKQADELIEGGDFRSAYVLLKNHADKVDAADYDRLMELLQRARLALYDQLVEQINDNIERAPDNPAELMELSSDLNGIVTGEPDKLEPLQEIDTSAHRALEVDIEVALNEQIAAYDFEAARKGQQSAAWRRALISYQAIRDPDIDRLFYIRVTYTIMMVHETLIQVEQEEAHDRAQTRLDRVLSDVTDLAQDRQGEPIASGLRYLIYVRQAELSNTPQKVRERIGRAEAEIRVWSPYDEDYNVLNEMVQEYKDRQQTILALAQIAESIQSKLIMDTPLSGWIAACRSWDEAVDGIRIRVGLERWIGDLFERIYDELRVLIADETRLWSKLDPLARQLILKNILPPYDLDRYAEDLRQETIAYTSDTDIVRTTLFTEQIQQLHTLQNASVALFYLCEERILQPADTEEGAQITTNVGQAAFELLEQQTAALETMDEINGHLKQIRDLLNKVRTTGEFDQVANELELFDSPTKYRIYRNHTDVQVLIEQAKAYEQEYNNYRRIADQVETAIADERFGRALNLLTQLESPEAQNAGAITMVVYSDPFADREWTNLKQVRAVLEKKRNEIDTLMEGLKQLVDVVALRDAIAGLSRQDLWDENYVIKLRELHMGSYADIETEVLAHVTNGDYRQALCAITALYDGNPDQDSSATFFRPGIMSLNQALALVQQFLQTHSVESLSSMTARHIYRWCMETRKRIQADVDQIKGLFDTISTRRKRFDRVKTDFMRAYDGLKKRMQRPVEREEWLRKLRKAYVTMHGNAPLVAGIDVVSLDLDEPISPRYTGLDARYQEWHAEIQNKLGDDDGRKDKGGTVDSDRTH